MTIKLNTANHSRTLFTIAFAFFIFGMAGKGFASGVNVKIVPDTILIGQPATMLVEVEANREDVFVPLSLTDSIYNHLEFRGSRIDTVSISENRLKYNISILLTSWDFGQYHFEPIEVIFLQNGDSLIYTSNEFSLEVLTLDIGEEAEIYDIKPIKIMKASLKEILTYFIPILIVLALIGWFVYIRFIKKKKIAPASIWEDDEIPAHIAAISSLEGLRNKKLWQAGKVKQYHSELTFIVRMFIEKRFDVPALEMTSSEICRALPAHVHTLEPLEQLAEALKLADLVKFAKYQPLPNENDKSLEQAIVFVKANIPPKEEEKDFGNEKKNDQKKPEN